MEDRERVKKINIECRPSVRLQGINTWLMELPVKKKKKNPLSLQITLTTH